MYVFCRLTTILLWAERYTEETTPKQLASLIAPFFERILSNARAILMAVS
jgi:hypothetical protein